MDFTALRAELVKNLRNEIKDRRVLEAVARVPRELFVPGEERVAAYEDRPLPIGFEQTISQPLIIAMMTEALRLTGGEKVLEIGTGSGYQTAILAEMARRVISVERIPALAESSGKLLRDLGYTNVEIQVAGDTLGWQGLSPYDAIIVTAGSPSVPVELVGQLSIGGRMVIPVGSRYNQRLYCVTRGREQTEVKDMGGCRFVPLIGKNAWED